MSNLFKSLAVLILLLAISFFLGYKKGSGNVITVTKEIKGETQIQYKDRIVTVTKIIRPDGTIEETTKTEDKSKSTTKKETQKDVAVTPAKDKYSLGLITSPHVERDGMSVRKVKLLPGVTAGYNLGNDIWVKFGTVPADSIYVMGIEITF